jgi:predicted proteasome-type protease
MIADTRTNAGLDDVSTFRKLHIFSWPGDRTFGLMTAGNLSVTQSVVSLLHEGIANPETGEMETLLNAGSMFRAAQLVGRCIRSVRETDGPALKEAGVKYDVSMLFGGQIKGQPMRLFMIYGAGNFIECGQDAPFLQIGEHKYGKPILDRAVTFKSHLYDALKVGLVQCFAMIPGTSRSGSTIIGGMLLGLSRQAATDFSFFLAIPTLIGAGAYSLYKERALLSMADVPLFAVGLLFSFVSAWLCVRWLLKYISTHTFVPFAYYRIVFGIVVLATAWTGMVVWAE